MLKASQKVKLSFLLVLLGHQVHLCGMDANKQQSDKPLLTRLCGCLGPQPVSEAQTVMLHSQAGLVQRAWRRRSEERRALLHARAAILQRAWRREKLIRTALWAAFDLRRERAIVHLFARAEQRAASLIQLRLLQRRHQAIQQAAGVVQARVRGIIDRRGAGRLRRQRRFKEDKLARERKVAMLFARGEQRAALTVQTFYRRAQQLIAAREREADERARAEEERDQERRRRAEERVARREREREIARAAEERAAREREQDAAQVKVERGEPALQAEYG